MFLLFISKTLNIEHPTSNIESRRLKTSQLNGNSRLSLIVCLFLLCPSQLNAAETDSFSTSQKLLQEFCFECHGNEQAEARINLERMTADLSFNSGFKNWNKAAAMLEQGKMPPDGTSQPSDAQRRQLVSAIQSEMKRVVEQHAGDPGRVVMRRLTSAEYAYTIRDLTGLYLTLERDFAGDAVGGEGFTNVGGVQFVQDSTLERYLEAAKKVASHAVIGAGPLQFYDDPGKTGFELSAITRIQEIYRANGFRTAAGEGGEAFGLELYPRAFYTAWRYRHREQLGLKNATVASLASDDGLSVRFADHIWSVLNDDQPTHPMSEIVAAWHKLPTPADNDDQLAARVREQCDDLFELLSQWQHKLGQNADDKEEARLLAADTFNVRRTKSFILTPIRTEDISEVTIHLVVEAVHPGGSQNPTVIWRNPEIQFRHKDLLLEDPKPISSIVSGEDAERLKFGKHPAGGNAEPHDIVTTGVGRQSFVLPIPKGVRSARLIVEVELDVEHGDDCIIQCSISDSKNSTEWKSVTGLLANSTGTTFKTWKRGVLEFARQLPQISHREPAPSDRDPIPPPFDNSYNNAERNAYHYKIKYHRDDRFLVDHILNDATRKELDHAWADLLGSFEYHDTFLKFVANKYKLDIGDRRIAELETSWIDRLPPEPRKFVRHLYEEYAAIQNSFEVAQPQHIEGVLRLANRTWRRPLTDDERNRLRAFYEHLIDDESLDHSNAIRTLLARVLVAPDFIYRAEGNPVIKLNPLTDWELASRLSYFLWSSLPDAELRRSAAAGELSDLEKLSDQARRMLADPKARRLATEFFGQWFGFYKFDRYAGVDPQRFPEFTDQLKSAMYDEAIAFFEHIVRRDRPAREILFADYVFVNRELAGHYGIDVAYAASVREKNHAGSVPNERIENVNRFNRGGLFGLGAVLTSTSAPLRTSPVKRGDWILRRVLDSPVPPPPADAGSISADDVHDDGLTVRQRLEVHRRNPTCNNCHSRIDPLGFALEHYDALGRWRKSYRDGQPIDASGKLMNGTVISGPNGLRDYLESNEKMFLRTLCTKLLGYALGRRKLLTDSVLIDQMMADLKRDGRFSNLVESIVRSKQFRYHGSQSDAVR